MRRVRRRLLGAALAALVAVCAYAPMAPAGAQGGLVALQLLQQSPWSSAYRAPVMDLELLATNGSSDTLTDLTLAVSFGPRIETLSEYGSVLASGPETILSTVSKSVRGEIPPGNARTISATIDLAEVAAIDQTDAQTYPAVVQLLANGVVVSSLITPVIYLVRPPVAPMLSSTWVELPGPIAFDATGTLTDPSFQAAIAPNGALRAPLEAMATTVAGRSPHGSLDLVIDPLLISQCHDLADGYRTADGTEVSADDARARAANRYLSLLSEVTADQANVETVATPYANPLLPAMLADYPTGDLEPELLAETSAGATVVAGVGATPVATVARPGGGQLSDTALDWLAGTGTQVVLADAHTVERVSSDTTLSVAPGVPMSTDAGDLTLLEPDPDVQTLFSQTTLLADPVRAAQVVLGQLSLIWKQRPVPSEPTVRGVAVAPPSNLPPQMWGPLLSRLTRAPFLAPVTATAMVATANPSNPNTEQPLSNPSAAAFSPEYAAQIQRGNDRSDAYGSMIVGSPDLATEVRRKLFVSTASPYVADPASGEQWLTAVDDATQPAFDAATPQVNPEITFTSREGTIPMVMGDPGPTPLQVTIKLSSKGDLTFPDGDTQNITIERAGQVVSFRVVANTSGQSPIEIVTRAPNGRPVGRKIVSVRSTAVNRIALLVTIAAALGLLALYSRRWTRRRRTPA